MNKLLMFATGGVMLCVVFGTIYAVGQQTIRQSANDPQIQLAMDTAERLDQGVKPDDLLGSRIDVDKSLAPAVIIYDTLGQVVVGSAYVAGSVPTIPFGVLQSTEQNRYTAVTWEPTPGVRLASVSVEANDYFVTAVRSLAEVEERELGLVKITLFGWLASLAGLGVIYHLTPTPRSKSKRR